MRYFKLGLLCSTLFLTCTSDTENVFSIFTNSKAPNILFLIADDWSYPHASIYGDRVVRTPTFDWLAKEGAVFQNAYCAAPSCSPSRAAILTGRYPHQLESGGNLWSVFPGQYPNWVRLLEGAGYHTGSTRKGWGPGDFERGGYQHNPAGKPYTDIQAFLQQREHSNQPFYFWFGSTDPHRVYERNTGVKTGMKAGSVEVPAFMPDLECVKNDILDYYFEVERFDRECGQLIQYLEDVGELDNTLIVMTSDNGMPFPRAKANLYDYGTRMPLVMYWKGKIKSGTEINEFVSFIDFAPTFIEAAKLIVSSSFSGQSLWPLLEGMKQEARDKVFLERERHANVRAGDLSYPCRAIRTQEYLYIKNFEPDRWPAGDPTTYQSVGQYGDVDNSISKFLMLDMEEKNDSNYFNLAFGKRPAEELYLIKEDPFNLNNIAGESAHEEPLNQLRGALQTWMQETGDLRANEPHTIYWDTVEYTPNYQFKDFDLQAEIDTYEQMKAKPRGNSFEASKCL